MDMKKPGKEEPAKQSERRRKYKGRNPREAITIEVKETSPCKKEGSAISVVLNQADILFPQWTFGNTWRHC